MNNCEMCGRTFTHKGILVVVIRVSKGTVSDFDSFMVAVKRFVGALKSNPQKYHMIIDCHRTVDLPIDRMAEINVYLQKKERHVRPNVLSSSYIVQGRAAASIVDTMFSMFGSWTHNKTFECYPNKNTDDNHGHGIPDAVLPKLLEFMDTAAPQKAQ